MSRQTDGLANTEEQSVTSVDKQYQNGINWIIKLEPTSMLNLATVKETAEQ
jgi:hypothetical protein